MSRSFIFARRFSALNRPTGLLLSLALAAFLSSAAHAQFDAPPAGTQVHDPAALRPPAGARVALCRVRRHAVPRLRPRQPPLLKEAAAKYKIPWVRHDFPLPMHNWSFQAAVNARWFDTKGKTLGDEYRDQVFANQASILRLPTRFASSLRSSPRATASALPFAIDPQGKLAADGQGRLRPRPAHRH